ncbi:hypothetical protein XM47_13780 [Catenovulum maritimum]|uniref:peptidoglycan glycosyltransferase n=2 Tax=Catenovulum maritimum TaxID=1513271 RepID=A0A0J8JJH2_9ALTE|nr:hypothetical protein XM47_13780 [Catenovulum maritimum]
MRIFAICLCLLSLGLFGYINTPVDATLFKQPYSWVLFAEDKSLLAASIAEDEQWRFPASEALPEKYVEALLTFEDKRFYQHIGIDFLALARAIKLNLNQGRIVSGASTISMQLARLLKKHNERSFSAKLSEVLLALKLEYQLSKEQILIEYTARAPYGGNILGISAASWRYFNHGLAELSWAEAAMLAVLPNNPAMIHLAKNRTQLKQKRDKLLDNLAQRGFISELDLKLAKLEALPSRPKPIPQHASHLLTSLKQKYPQQHLFHSHIHFQTQLAINQLLSGASLGLSHDNIHNLSAVVIDNANQQVLAYIGNQTLSENVNYAKSLDIAQRPRSSGSLLKPFLFAMAFQQGMILPSSLLPDIPSYYQGYQPKNYDREYRGLVSAEQALIQSLNVPAVNLLADYGVPFFYQNLQDIGLSTLWRQPDEYGLSLILGGAETNLVEMTQAYSRLMLSAQGQLESQLMPSYLVNQVSQVKPFPINQAAAWLTLEVLTGLNRPGINSLWKSFASQQKIAWKTGTSYGWHDAWAVGTNGRYTVGVWAGNANGEEARKLSGSLTSAPLMLDIFNILPKGTWPEKPLRQLKSYQVCQADGYLAAGGCKTTTALAPIEAEFTQLSPYHKQVNLDPVSLKRVHGLCFSPAKMWQKSYLILPAVTAYYYRQTNPNWRTPPEWRTDCTKQAVDAMEQLNFAFEYPPKGAKIKLPVELDGKLGRLVAKAHHINQNEVLYWHLDNEFIGTSQHIHDQEIAVNSGWHLLTITNQQGEKIERWFKVI